MATSGTSARTPPSTRTARSPRARAHGKRALTAPSPGSSCRPIRWSTSPTARSSTPARRRIRRRWSSSAPRPTRRLASYTDVLVTEDWTPLEPDITERKFYAPGVGLVMERHVQGGHAMNDLTEFTAPRLNAAFRHPHCRPAEGRAALLIDALPTIGELPTGSVARSPSPGGCAIGRRRSPCMTATTTSVPGDRTPSLERDAIGLPEVLFQSITHMAPAVATALSIGAATGFAGGLTPLAVVLRHGGLPVHGLLDRPAGQASAVCGRHVHLRGPRPGTVLRLADGLGLRPGRAADRADPAGGLRLLRRRLPGDLPAHRRGLHVHVGRARRRCAGCCCGGSSTAASQSRPAPAWCWASSRSRSSSSSPPC